MLKRALNGHTLSRWALIGAIVPDWRELLDDTLTQLEQQDGEHALHTFRFKHRVFGLPVNVSFTLKVKHLRFILTALSGLWS